MKDQKKSLKSGFVMNAILTASQLLFPLVTFPYVSRVLLPAGTGRVSFATSVISYFLMLAQLGIPVYGVRACAKVRDDRRELTRTAQELLLLNGVTSLLACAALFFAIAHVDRLREDRLLYAVLSVSILAHAVGMEWLYRATEQYAYMTLRSIAFRAVSVVCLFLLVRGPQDVVRYGGITILAGCASSLLNLFRAHRFIDMKPVGHYRLGRHVRPMLVFFAMACATTVYTHLDTVMLGFMATDADVGYYHAAVRIKSILVSMVTSLGAVLLPRASYDVQCGRMDEFRRMTQKALRFVFVAAVPLMLYFTCFARGCIRFLSGAAYAGSVVPMRIIMPTLLCIGLTHTLGVQVLVPLGREKTVLASVVAGAATDVVLNALLIPAYASAGAAVGTLAAEGVVLCVQLAALRGEAWAALRSVPYGKIAAASAAGCLLSLPVRLTGSGVLTGLLLSAGVFFGAYVLTLWVMKEALAVEAVRLLGGWRRNRKTNRSTGR